MPSVQYQPPRPSQPPPAAAADWPNGGGGRQWCLRRAWVHRERAVASAADGIPRGRRQGKQRQPSQGLWGSRGFPDGEHGRGSGSWARTSACLSLPSSNTLKSAKPAGDSKSSNMPCGMSNAALTPTDWGRRDRRPSELRRGLLGKAGSVGLGPGGCQLLFVAASSSSHST